MSTWTCDGIDFSSQVQQLEQVGDCMDGLHDGKDVYWGLHVVMASLIGRDNVEPCKSGVKRDVENCMLLEWMVDGSSQHHVLHSVSALSHLADGDGV